MKKDFEDEMKGREREKEGVKSVIFAVEVSSFSLSANQENFLQLSSSTASNFSFHSLSLSFPSYLEGVLQNDKWSKTAGQFAKGSWSHSVVSPSYFRIFSCSGSVLDWKCFIYVSRILLTLIGLGIVIESNLFIHYIVNIKLLKLVYVITSSRLIWWFFSSRNITRLLVKVIAIILFNPTLWNFRAEKGRFGSVHLWNTFQRFYTLTYQQ